MKRLLPAVPFVVVLLLSACFLQGPQQWNGTVNGYQVFNLSVTQNNRYLTVTATVDSAALTEFQAQLASKGDTYQDPDEAFFWLSPKFKNDPSDSPTLYPVARKKMIPGQTTVTITLDLGKLANDWNVWWLEPYRFDGDQHGENDDMNGCLVYMSTGYQHGDGEDNYGTVSWTDNGTDLSQSVDFNNSFPAGAEVSNLLTYPDPSDTSITWQPVLLTPEGIYLASDTIRGGVGFDIILQLPSNQTAATLPDTLSINGPGVSGVSLGTADAVQDSTDLSKWIFTVRFGAGSSDPNPTAPGVYVGSAMADSYYDFNYSWYGASAYYLGEVTQILATDFDNDGKDVNVTGSFGLTALNLTKTTESYTQYVSYYPYYIDIPAPSNSTNNWVISQLDPITDAALLPPTGYISGSNVLGTGSGGLDVRDNYDNNRNDFVVFPAYDYFSQWAEYQSSNPNTRVVLSFKARVAFDWNYNDHMTVQIQRLDSNGNPSYWDQPAWIDGPLEGWELSSNNGWQEYRYYIQNYLDGDYNGSYGKQTIRIQFQSDGYGTYQGVLIDDFEVDLVQ